MNISPFSGSATKLAPTALDRGLAGCFAIDVSLGASPTLAAFSEIEDGAPILLGVSATCAATATTGLEGLIHTLAYPQGLLVLAEGLLNPTAEPGGSHRVFAPIAPFEAAAQRLSIARVVALSPRPGTPEPDLVLEGLAACLRSTVRARGPVDDFFDQIAAATIIHLTSEYGVGPARALERGLAPWQLRISRATMEQRLVEGVPVETLARECGLSTSHFSRAFKRSTGVAPHQWIARFRVQAAMRMIRSEDRTLLQVASACGFFDHSHLVRAFRRWAGCSPSVWRLAQQGLGERA